LRNPAIQILNWAGTGRVSVLVNGRQADFKAAMEGNSLLVWIQGSIAEESTVTIKEL
jgi:hypothetical protein